MEENSCVEELAELLKNDTSLEDEPQSAALSDKDMDAILSRAHMETGAKPPYKTTGPGWVVVAQLDGSGLLPSRSGKGLASKGLASKGRRNSGW